MCRSIAHGGRRCPGSNTTAAKKKAAANRKNNRRVKKKLVQHFQEIGLEDTAEDMKDTLPCQIPDLMEQLGISENILDGLKPPSAGNASPKHRDASGIVEKALAEAKEKNIELMTDIQDMVNDTELPPVDKETLINAFSDYLAQDTQGFHNPASIEGFVEEHDDLCRLVTRLNPDDAEVLDYSWWKNFTEEVRRNAVMKRGVDEVAEEFRVANENGSPETETPKPVEYSVMEEYRDRIFTDSLRTKAVKQYQVSNDINDLRKEIFYKIMASENSALTDYGNGLYLVKNIDAYMYAYAPNGVLDVNDITCSEEQNGFFTGFTSSFGASQTMPESFGLTHVSDESIREIMPKFKEFVELVKEEYEENDGNLQRVSEKMGRVVTNSDIFIHDKSVDDFQMAYSFSKGKTFIQRNGVTLDTSDISIKALRNFRAGLVVNGHSTVDPVSVERIESEYDNETKLMNMDEEVIHEHEQAEVDLVSTMMEDIHHEPIKTYTSSLYAIIADNSVGLSNEAKDFSDDYIRGINDELRKINAVTVKAPRKVYRSMTPPYGMTAEDYAEQFSSGEKVVTTKLTSTSHSLTQAYNFGSSKNVLCVYETRSGASIQDMSNFPEEREVLVPAGEEFVFLGKKVDNHGKVIMFFTDPEE